MQNTTPMIKFKGCFGRIISIGCLSLLLSVFLFSNSWAYADNQVPELKQSTYQVQELKQPIVLESEKGRIKDDPERGQLDVTLKVEYEAGTIGGGKYNSVCLRSYKLISYNGKKPPTPDPDETTLFVAPTLKVNPGDQLKIRIENNLPLLPVSGNATPCDKTLTTTRNLRSTPQPENYNITNLHTHGLEVSPEGISDNVFLKIGPGETQDYVFDIPKEHARGTFWYHPHYHESTAVQVSSGMTGALIVKGGLDNIIEKAKDKIFLFQQIPFTQDPDKKFQMVEKYNATSAKDTWLESGRISSINGQDLPKISLKTGELQRWRFIHGGVRQSLNLSLLPEDKSSAPLNFHEIAVDGLSLGEDAFSVEKNGSRHMNSKENIILQPGYRSDVLVKAKNPGNYYLTQVPPSSKNSIGIINPEPGQKLKLAMVEVVQGQEDTPLPEKLAPKPFESITQEEIGDSITRTITFEINTKTNPPQFLADGQEYHSDQPDRILNLPLGAAEQLKLVSNLANHPFHIHVNPFEVISIGGEEQKPHVWKDTILVSQNEPVIIRTRYNPKYPGKAVYHCHILDHEDQGMMRAVNFVAEHKKDK